MDENKTPDIYKGLDADPGFQVEKTEPTIIKVVGVGGGGNNAVNHMYEQKIQGVSFVVINTDNQALSASPVPNKLLIGPKTTKGLGAGNKPEVAQMAAKESEELISNLFDEVTKMVFITAGMGGGTGTGAAPVVAKLAHEKDKLVIGIVTIPFLFEGRKKIIKALDGAEEMGKYVDALLIINNQRLIDIYPDLDFNNAFGKADDTLTEAARSISEIITIQGLINLDFNDVNTTLRDGKVAIISSGYGEGEERVTKAIHDALNSPLLKNRDVYGSERVLINVCFNPDSKEHPFLAAELREVESFMVNFSHDVDVITGTAHDRTLGDRVKVTVLAAGFEISLSEELDGESNQNTKKSHPVDQSAAPSADKLSQRLIDQYGVTTISDFERKTAEAQYVVLKPEDIDNDELVDLLEHTPAFKREPNKKKAIEDKRINRQHAESAEVRPMLQHQQKPSNSGTIKFDAE